MRETDKTSIGLTSQTDRMLEDIFQQTGWFHERQDAARFAMAMAIQLGVTPGSTQGTETRWAAGNFDKTNEIKSIIRALYPESKTPVRLMEHLVNEGIKLLKRRLDEDGATPIDILSEAKNSRGNL